MVEIKPASCDTCNGACCRNNTAVGLNPAEVNFMKQSGTSLIQIYPALKNVNWRKSLEGETSEEPTEQKMFDLARGLKRGQGLYILDGDCGNLVVEEGQTLCAKHEDPERPKICKDFKPGSMACQKIRYNRGVDTYEEVALRLGVKPS